jgi:aldehyde dehydrogenase (NAD+)
MDFQQIIRRQADFFNTNQTREIRFRIEQLKKIKLLLKSNEKELYQAIYNDFRKSSHETYVTELSLIYNEIDEAISKLPQWSAQKRIRTNLVNLPGKSFIIPEPLGVCLVIGAWNYPYLLTLSPLVSAIAAGNTSIIKPGELASETSSFMANLINENFPPEYLFVVEGGIPETSELLEQKFDKIFFTGSTKVGRIVYQAAAKNLTPVTLELGGKNPAIVTANCNLKGSVKRLVWAKFLNAGQTCVAPDFILVEETIKEKLLDELEKQIEKADFSINNSNYCQIVNDRNFNRLVDLIEQQEVFSGGRFNAFERYISPTILKNVGFEDPIMQDEIFGPVLPVISYTDLNEAISQIKMRPRPLACYVFTNAKVIRDRVLNEISFGGGAVNDAVMHIANGYLPFGGVGESGMGSYHGKAGFAAFSHFKSILDKPFWGEPNLKYSPYSNTKLNWIKRLT